LPHYNFNDSSTFALALAYLIKKCH